MMDIQSLWVALNLLGLGAALWLALLWRGRSGGWPAARARAVVVVAASVALAFALASVAPFAGLQGPGVPGGLTRLLLLALPVSWLWLGQRLVSQVVPAASRWLGWVVALLSAITLLFTLYVHLIEPTRLALSWLFFPLYVVILLTMGAGVGRILWLRRQRASSALERHSLSWLGLGTIFVVIGGLLTAGDLTLGLSHPLFAPLTDVLFPSEWRLLSTVALLIALVALHRCARSQARAEGAPFLAEQRRAWRLSGTLLLTFLLIGSFFLWLWRMPLGLLGLLGLLALLAEPLLAAQSEQARAAPMPGGEPFPPAIYAQLSRIARQLNLSQLGLALPDENGQGFFVVAALHPSWEGERLDVRDVSSWEARGLSGWNLPLKDGGRTVAILASSGGGALSAVQQALAREGGAQIVALLDAWQRLHQEWNRVESALTRYETRLAELEPQLGQAGQQSAPPDLQGAVRQALATWTDDEALRRSDLAELTLLSGTPAGQRAAAIRELLQHLIEQLRPYENESAPLIATPAWRPYLLLQQHYIERIPQDEVEVALQVSSRAFQRVERQAIGEVARTLAELEAAARQLGEDNLPPMSAGRPSASSRQSSRPRPAPQRPRPAPRAAPAPDHSRQSSSPFGGLSDRFMESARKMKPSRQSAPSVASRATQSSSRGGRRGNSVWPATQSGDERSTPDRRSPGVKPKYRPPAPDPELPEALKRPKRVGLRRSKAVPKPQSAPEEPRPPDDFHDEEAIEIDD